MRQHFSEINSFSKTFLNSRRDEHSPHTGMTFRSSRWKNPNVFSLDYSLKNNDWQKKRKKKRFFENWKWLPRLYWPELLPVVNMHEQVQFGAKWIYQLSLLKELAVVAEVFFNLNQNSISMDCRKHGNTFIGGKSLWLPSKTWLFGDKTGFKTAFVKNVWSHWH